MSQKRYKLKFLRSKKYNYIPFAWVSIHNEPNIEKQDLQVGERWWQDSNSTTSYIQEQKKKKNTKNKIETDM